MKLKRGQKLCKNCQAVNAARQRVCITCNKPFQLKNTPIKHEIKDWQNLQKGDTFRVVNGTGSYYVLKRDCSEGEEGAAGGRPGVGRAEEEGRGQGPGTAPSHSVLNHCRGRNAERKERPTRRRRQQLREEG